MLKIKNYPQCWTSFSDRVNIYSISDENTDLSISLGLTLAVVETSMGVRVAGVSDVGGESLQISGLVFSG